MRRSNTDGAYTVSEMRFSRDGGNLSGTGLETVVHYPYFIFHHRLRICSFKYMALSSRLYRPPGPGCPVPSSVLRLLHVLPPSVLFVTGDDLCWRPSRLSGALSTRTRQIFLPSPVYRKPGQTLFSVIKRKFGKYENQKIPRTDQRTQNQIDPLNISKIILTVFNRTIPKEFSRAVISSFYLPLIGSLPDFG